jgi:hypothetical protein
MKRFVSVLFVVLVLAAVFALPVMAQSEEPPIALPDITALTLGTIIAAVLSLLLDYFPGVAAKFDALSVAAKRQLVAVFAVAIVGVVFALTCTDIVTSNLVCSTAGAWDAISNIIYVFVIGQGVHAGTKPTENFKANVLNIPPA